MRGERTIRRLIARRWLLLALFLGIGLPLAAFRVLGEEVAGRQPADWEVAALWLLYDHAHPALDALMLGFTIIGAPSQVLILAGLGVILLIRRQRHGDAIFLILAVGGATMLSSFAKLLYQRPRPDLWNVLWPESTYAFPSGHAMGSMALVVALVVVCWGTRRRWIVLTGGGAFAIGVGVSRLYLGVHYPSDVVAGWCAASAWAIGVHALRRAPLPRRAPFRRPDVPAARPGDQTDLRTG